MRVSKLQDYEGWWTGGVRDNNPYYTPCSGEGWGDGFGGLRGQGDGFGRGFQRRSRPLNGVGLCGGQGDDWGDPPRRFKARRLP